MQATILTPLFRNSIGFDRFNDLFETMLESGKNNEVSYPPYNIEKLSENHYRITMAVAGLKPDELEVITHEDHLIISASCESREKNENIEYLHKGIATRSFKRKFSLTDYMKVKNANVADGLLTIDLEREVPEASKPQKIAISYGEPTQKTAETKAIEHQKLKTKNN